MCARVSQNPRSRLPVKSSYRVLLLGDSLTVGYYWSAQNHTSHPYVLYLDHMLSLHHPHLSFEFLMEAEGGECVISTCTRESLLSRLQHRLDHVDPDTKQKDYFDLAIIMGGTNDIYHDFDAADVWNGIQTLHRMIWNQIPPTASGSEEGAAAAAAVGNKLKGKKPLLALPPFSPKTIGLTIPEWGEDDSWRPPKRPSKLHPKLAHAARGFVNSRLRSLCTSNPAHSEQCSTIDLDVWFPRRSLTPREKERKWAENVHPTPYGYDEIGLIIYQHLKRILPQN